MIRDIEAQENLFLSMPLVLGSLISFVVFLIYPAIISKRIRNEEDLEKELTGYDFRLQGGFSNQSVNSRLPREISEAFLHEKLL